MQINPAGITPFGRRAVTRACLETQEQVRLAPAGSSASKWQVFQDLRLIRERLGASDRALAILNALLSFHPGQQLVLGENCVVWPSNERLRTRANGMSLPTLRRHLANLVACGLVVRRDSPNGKRYARTGASGVVTSAFGFDLSPLVVRAAEFASLAATINAEREAHRFAREQATLARRDVAKLLEFARTQGAAGPWDDIAREYADLLANLPRSPGKEMLEELCARLQQLGARITSAHGFHNTLQLHGKTGNLSASASQDETHIEESITKESEVTCRQEELLSNAAASGPELSLAIVLDHCPDIAWLSRDGRIKVWSELVDAMTPARAMLGLGQESWREACAMMGVQNAALAVAVIYQAGDRISSPAHYLARLARQARRGAFSPWALLMAHGRKLAPATAQHSVSKPRAMAQSLPMSAGGAPVPWRSGGQTLSTAGSWGDPRLQSWAPRGRFRG